MNKKTITLKVDDYTIILHRGEEESKEMEQKRMALYACLSNFVKKQIIKHFEKYYPKLQPVVCNILKKAESKMLNGNLLIDEIK